MEGWAYMAGEGEKPETACGDKELSIVPNHYTHSQQIFLKQINPSSQKQALQNKPLTSDLISKCVWIML